MFPLTSIATGNRLCESCGIVAWDIVEWPLDTMDELARMNEDEDKSSALPAIILLLLVILIGFFCVEFGVQTLTWLEAKHAASANSWLADTPQTSPAVADDVSKPQLAKAFNYQFNVPWQSKIKVAESLPYVQFNSDSGQVVVFFDPASQLDSIHSLKSSNPTEYQKFSNVFADHPIDSNFGLYQAVYGASPAQFSPVMKVEDARRSNVLLLWKLSFGPDLQSAAPEFYSFDWGKIRGFQFGDPAKEHPVALRVFDDNNRQFRFIFAVAAGSSGKITQSDINMAVRSLQPEQ